MCNIIYFVAVARHHSSLKEPTHSETKVNFKVHRHNSGNSRTDVRNGYDRSSTSTPTDLSNSDAVAPILELKYVNTFVFSCTACICNTALFHYFYYMLKCILSLVFRRFDSYTTLFQSQVGGGTSLIFTG